MNWLLLLVLEEDPFCFRCGTCPQYWFRLESRWWALLQQHTLTH